MSDAQRSTAHSHAPRVLVIAPEPIMHHAKIAAVLRDAGFDVLEAADVMAGPELPPAVLIADADRSRSGMEGIAQADEARRRWPDLGVVYVTGHSPSRLDGHVLGRRDRFVPKPVAPLTLARAVHGLLASHPAAH